MGRMASWSRVPRSGAVIFYGVSSTGKGGAVEHSQDGNKDIAEIGSKSGSTTGPTPDSPPIPTDSKAKVSPSTTSGILPISSSMLIRCGSKSLALQCAQTLTITVILLLQLRLSKRLLTCSNTRHTSRSSLA
jgi:hypothetical protein